MLECQQTPHSYQFRKRVTFHFHLHGKGHPLQFNGSYRGKYTLFMDRVGGPPESPSISLSITWLGHF